MIISVMLMRVLILVMVMMRRVPVMVMNGVDNMDNTAVGQKRMRSHRWPERHQDHRDELAEQPHSAFV